MTRMTRIAPMTRIARIARIVPMTRIARISRLTWISQRVVPGAPEARVRWGPAP